MTEPMHTFAPPEGSAPGGGPGDPAAPSPVAVPPKKGSGRLVNAALAIAVVVAVAGVTFALGRATAPASASGFPGVGDGGLPGAGSVPGGSFDPGAAGGPGAFGGRTMTMTGTVTAVDGSTMTLTTSGGQTVTIDTSESTYHAQAAATAADVTTGSSVQVSVTGMGGFGRPDASAAPDAGAGTSTISATDVTILAGD